MNTTKFKVVVTDYTFPDLDTEREIIATIPAELIGRQCRTETELIELCRDADAVITQFARLNANVINAMTRARVIVRYGIGVDNVDLAATQDRGIPVCNIPDYCIDEVADHTLACILGSTRSLLPHTRHLCNGKWGMAVPLTSLNALRDLTVGVVGFGRIGREVVKRLASFKCAVCVFDPVVPAVEIEKTGAHPMTFEHLLAHADVLTLHCPSTPQTRRLMNRDTLGRMKRGAVLINLGRGDLVDLSALVAALADGRLGSAALDVFDAEPIPIDHPLLKMTNVILTPHIAALSPTSVKKLRETAAQLTLRALLGEALPNVVNGVKPGLNIATARSNPA